MRGIHESLPSINHGAKPVRRLIRRRRRGEIVSRHETVIFGVELGFWATDVMILEK
jgi:hypothetical protein